MSARTDIAIREYRDEDEVAVLDLLVASLGGGPAGHRPAEFFRWKHIDNPFGRSLLLVAETDGGIAGLRAFMRWRFEAGGASLSAVRAVDTATRPDLQGRGIFSRLTLAALDQLRSEGVDLVFNTPNEKSAPGYLKMGWRLVGRVPIAIGIRRPVRFAAAFAHLSAAVDQNRLPLPRGSVSAAEALSLPGVDDLVREEAEHRGRVATERSPAFLRWRYGDAPLLAYRAVVSEGPTGIRGIALFRVRRRGTLVESTIADVIVRRGDVATARRLIRDAGRGVDHVTCTFPTGTTGRRAAFRAGCIRAPGGMTMTTNPLRPDLRPDPLRLTSWALTLGDLEVF